MDLYYTKPRWAKLNKLFSTCPLTPRLSTVIDCQSGVKRRSTHVLCPLQRLEANVCFFIIYYHFPSCLFIDILLFFISHTLSPLTHYAMAVIDSKFSALRWDELVPDDRLLKWTDTNLQKQQQLRDMHIRRKTPRSSSSRSSTQQDTTSESRGRKRHRDSTTDKPRTVRLSFSLSLPLAILRKWLLGRR